MAGFFVWKPLLPLTNYNNTSSNSSIAKINQNLNLSDKNNPCSLIPENIKYSKDIEEAPKIETIKNSETSIACIYDNGVEKISLNVDFVSDITKAQEDFILASKYENSKVIKENLILIFTDGLGTTTSEFFVGHTKIKVVANNLNQRQSEELLKYIHK